MLEPRGNDLLAFVIIFVVLPLITYFLLGILNDTTKKKERIHSVVHRAPEEAQSGIMAVGNYAPIVQSPNNGTRHCAKCIGSAKTRCSHCKSVWYCSGRCQVLHWRQAHKLECRKLSQDAYVKQSDLDHSDNICNDLELISSENTMIEEGSGNHNDFIRTSITSIDSAYDTQMAFMNEEISLSNKGIKSSLNYGSESSSTKRNDKSRSISRFYGIHELKSPNSNDKFARESQAVNKSKSAAVKNEMKILTLMDVKKTPKNDSKYSEDKVREAKMIYPYEEFLKCFQYEVLNIIPRGLVNCGNSCYANAVLQCLTCTKPLIIYLLHHSHSKSGCEDRCIMCELEKLVVMRKETGEALSPRNVLMYIRSLNSQIGHGSQEDAHEFLRLLVASMQSICLEGENVDPRHQDTTFVQHLFEGRLRSKVRCLRCNHESERYESIMDLILEISGKVESLEDALAQFTSPEDLDGENMYRCVRCDSYVRARKQLNIQESPNILTVVLKRFQEGSYRKASKCITFPEILDIVPFMTGPDDIPPFYVLYGVIVHLDTSNVSFSGHYISYVKDLLGNWFCVDDSEVRPVDSNQVMSEGAYILFYMRSSPRPATVTKTKTNHSSSKSELSEPNYSMNKRQQLDNRLGMSAELSKYRHFMLRNNSEFPEAGSSEWSLFTSSDDSSFTTESTRDSFSSTIDQGDIPFSSIFQSLYPHVFTSKSKLQTIEHEFSQHDRRS